MAGLSTAGNPMPIALILILPFILFPLVGWAALSRIKVLGQSLTLSTLFSAFGAGILIHYLIVMLIQSFWWCAGITLLFATAGLLSFLRKWNEWQSVFRKNGLLLFLVAGATGIYTSILLSVPVEGADAYYFWFFLAKQMHFAESFNLSPLGRGPGSGNHLDYPRLVPLLGGEIAWLLGRWNEFLPKFAYGILIGAGFLGLAGAYVKRVAYAFLIYGIVAGLGYWLYNSYVDGYVALFSGLGLLYVGRAIDSEKASDRWAAAISLALASCLKNEGKLFLFIIAALLICYQGLLLLRRRKWHFPSREILGAVGFAFLPIVVWSVICRIRDFGNYLALDTSAGQRAMARLSEPQDIHLIFTSLWTKADWNKAFWFWLLAGLALAIFRRTFSRGALLSLAAAILYSAGMGLAYFITPDDLSHHIRVTAYRILAIGFVSLIVGAYFSLLALESGKDSDSSSKV